MPQSLVKTYIHVVSSTKHRRPIILPNFANELYNYIGGTCANLECFPVIVGGHVDHVHILCLLSKKISIIKFIGELKANSSKWFKTKDEKLKNFYWQNGYGVFSVNPSEVDVVSSYIVNQHLHHKITSFQDEYRSFLNKYKIDFDERFVWDWCSSPSATGH